MINNHTQSESIPPKFFLLKNRSFLKLSGKKYSQKALKDESI